MKIIDLIKVEHSRKIGKSCEYIEPNLTENCILYSSGQAIGFYLNKMPDKMCKLANLANAEFRTKNVPKQKMNRSDTISKVKEGMSYKDAAQFGVSQLSTILGSTPPRPHMLRPYPSRSSVHSVKNAQNFIKSMLLLAKESEKLIQELLPKQYDKQLKLLQEIDSKWRFGNLFTSSISNYNISAPFHKDNGNIQGSVNVIICKKKNSKGGDLHVPDYGATFGQQDNSILVYPAWKNVHAVTPITPIHEGGYRNSLIFYPLKAFKKL